MCHSRVQSGDQLNESNALFHSDANAAAVSCVLRKTQIAHLVFKTPLTKVELLN
jgi:hypothetical protein